MPCWSLQAPTWNTIDWGGAGGWEVLHYRQALLPVLEAGRLGSGASGSALGGGTLPRLQKAGFTWRREVIGLMSLLLGTLISLTPPLRPNYFPKVLSSNIITWRLELWPMT